jgi:anti-sigma-K factor RskA
MARPEMDALAAEYLLGVLDHDEREEVRMLIDGDGTMRMLTEAWEDGFAPLNARYPLIAAPDV